MARRQSASWDEEQGLLNAIHADPRDDTPRLVYADWLEDHGQADYAEFIRLQCSRAGTVGLGEFLRRGGITLREVDLEEQHGAEWTRPVNRLTRAMRFLRGLPLVNLTRRAYRGDYPDAIVAGSSPRARFEVEMIGWVKGHLASEMLSRTAILHVINCTEEDVHLLASCPHLPKMERIAFAERMTEATQALSDQLLAPRVPLRYWGY